MCLTTILFCVKISFLKKMCEESKVSLKVLTFFYPGVSLKPWLSGIVIQCLTTRPWKRRWKASSFSLFMNLIYANILKCRKEMYSSQTHFDFTNLGSEVYPSRVIAISFGKNGLGHTVGSSLFWTSKIMKSTKVISHALWVGGDIYLKAKQ